MNKNKAVFLSAILLLFLALTSVSYTSAAPGNNPLFATIEYVDEKIRELTHVVQQNETRSQNNESDLNFLKRLARTQGSEIDSLQQDVATLSAKLVEVENDLIIEPLDVVFFDDAEILTSSSQKSEWFDTGKYSELVLSYQCKAYTSTSEYGATIDLLVSNDMNTTVNVFSASKAECHSGGTVNLSVAGKYYQVWVGSNSNIVDPPMTVSVIGRFK